MNVTVFDLEIIFILQSLQLIKKHYSKLAEIRTGSHVTALRVFFKDFNKILLTVAATESI